MEMDYLFCGSLYRMYMVDIFVSFLFFSKIVLYTMFVSLVENFVKVVNIYVCSAFINFLYSIIYYVQFFQATSESKSKF